MCLGPKIGRTDRHVGRWDMRTEAGPLPARAPLSNPSLYHMHAPSIRHRLGHGLRLELAAWMRIHSQVLDLVVAKRRTGCSAGRPARRDQAAKVSLGGS